MCCLDKAQPYIASRTVEPVSNMECDFWQVQNCLLKLMNQQLSAAFNAMRDEAQTAAQKRQALKFWTQRSLLAAFNAFRWTSSAHSCAHTDLASLQRILPRLMLTSASKV